MNRFLLSNDSFSTNAKYVTSYCWARWACMQLHRLLCCKFFKHHHVRNLYAFCRRICSFPINRYMYTASAVDGTLQHQQEHYKTSGILCYMSLCIHMHTEQQQNQHLTPTGTAHLLAAAAAAAAPLLSRPQQPARRGCQARPPARPWHPSSCPGTAPAPVGVPACSRRDLKLSTETRQQAVNPLHALPCSHTAHTGK